MALRGFEEGAGSGRRSAGPLTLLPGVGPLFTSRTVHDQQSELLADFSERVLALAADAEPQPDDLLLSRREGLQDDEESLQGSRTPSWKCRPDQPLAPDRKPLVPKPDGVVATHRRVVRKNKQRELTIRVDLGDKTSRYCVLDREGNVLFERSTATTKKGLAQAFASMGASRIAMEVGTHSPWVKRLLESWNHEVIVANAHRVKLITERTRKDDRLDARRLARLASVDPELLSPIRHRSEGAQAHLVMIRARAVLVEARTKLVNSARGVTKSFGERLASCDPDQMRVKCLVGLPSSLQSALQPAGDGGGISDPADS